MKIVDISIVVPIYKEEENIDPFVDRIDSIFKDLDTTYEIIFSLDPSPDGTKDRVLDKIKNNNKIKLIEFSRRFGQPAATIAGIYESAGNYVVVIDVDLQDPPELILKMYKKITEGFDVIYAKRTSRKGETIIKKIISYLGYKLIQTSSDIHIPKIQGILE